MTENTASPVTVTADKTHFAERFHSPLTGWTIFGISLVFTLTAYFFSRQLVEHRLHDQFQYRADEITRAVEDRSHMYEQMLWSGVALFYASRKLGVERQNWAAFVEGLSLDQQWPGIQGMGYSIPVSPEDKLAHINSIRTQGFLEYSIKPEGERNEYSTIIYLEPFDWRNKRAFGFDMWSDPLRRSAMRRARDSGMAATSGLITLVQETGNDVQRGFLTYVPVYKSNNIPDTLTGRQRQFQGWVYAAFRTTDLMQGILGSRGNDIVFDIYDGEKISPESLLFSSLNIDMASSVSSSKDSDASGEHPLFSEKRVISIQGRPWTIVFRARADITSSVENKVPIFVAITGLVIDLLLFYAILSLNYVNRRAKTLAEAMTLKLRLAKTELEAKVRIRTEELRFARDKLDEKVRQRTDELNTKICELEKMNQLTVGRELRIIELKQEVNTFVMELGRERLYDIEDPNSLMPS